MRPVGTFLLLFVAVMLGGALVAPCLYWGAQTFADQGPWFSELARQPFHRFVHRAMLALGLPAVWLLARQLGVNSWAQIGIRRCPGSGRQFAHGALLGFVLLAAVTLLALAFDARHWNGDLSPALLGQTIVTAALSALAVGTLEEILFRGALFGGLRRGHPWPIALLASSAFYALVHFFKRVQWTQEITWSSGLQVLGQMLKGFADPQALLPGFFVLMLAGLILGLGYQKTNALWFSIGAHSTWIFWLKVYGALTVEQSAARAPLWKSFDGWIAALVLVIAAVLLWEPKRLRPSHVGLS